MTWPTTTVEIDFASNPGDALSAATWTDVTSYVRSVKTFRGKQQERDPFFQAGVATVVLDNRDGRFDPNNTSSPYAPNVLPMRRIRIRATDPAGGTGDGAITYDQASVTYDAAGVAYDGTVHDVFVGYVQEWPQTWRAPSDAIVRLSCADGFAVLANKTLPESVWDYEVAADGPAHWWKLNETSGTTAIDHASNAIDGTYVGSPTLGTSDLVEHRADAAVTFDGVDDRIDLPTSAALPSPFTVEMVVSMSTVAVVDRFILLYAQNPMGTTQYGTPTTFAFDLRVSAFSATVGRPLATIYVGTYPSGTQYLAYGDGRIDDGNPHHVAVTYDGTSLKVYVDGTVGTTTGSPPSGPASGDASIGDLVAGADPDPAGLGGAQFQPFAGVIDEVVRYDSALSAARLSAHASAVDTAWNGDTSGARIGRVLDVVGWPAADRDLDTGASTFGDADIAGHTALSYVNLCADSEAGHLFVTADGRVRFVGRHNLLTETVYSVSQATFADVPGAGEFGYHDLELDAFGVDDVYNQVEIQRKYGITQTVEDATSQARYLKRTLSKTGLLMNSDLEARDAANWYLTRFKDPVIKISKMVLTPGGDDALWAQVLGRELMDRVTVQRDPPGSGTVLSQEAHIVGIEHEIGPASWRTTMWLSPADTTAYWVLGDATFSVLDSTTRLAY